MDEESTPFGPDPDLQAEGSQLDADPEMLELRADTAAGLKQQEPQANEAAATEQRRQRRYLVKALLRSPTFMVGLIVVLFWVFMAVFSTHITQDPTAVNAAVSLKAPSAAHLFGTDDLGRDVLARTMAGARSVLIIAPLATLLALLWGGIIGLIAGFYIGSDAAHPQKVDRRRQQQPDWAAAVGAEVSVTESAVQHRSSPPSASAPSASASTV